MSDMWTYRDSTWTEGQDLAGYDVEASDGSIGKIDEATNEAAGSYLVVDTGFWIFGKKRLIPAGVVSRVDHDSRNVYVNMTKEQIKSAPDYDREPGATSPARGTATTTAATPAFGELLNRRSELPTNLRQPNPGGPVRLPQLSARRQNRSMVEPSGWMVKVAADPGPLQLVRRAVPQDGSRR